MYENILNKYIALIFTTQLLKRLFDEKNIAEKY